MNDSTKLINEPPLLVLPTLAKEVGLSLAILLQQLHFLTYYSRYPAKAHNDKRWLKISREEMVNEFPFWHVNTISNLVAKGLKLGFLEAEALNSRGRDRTLWYAVALQNSQNTKIVKWDSQNTEIVSSHDTIIVSSSILETIEDDDDEQAQPISEISQQPKSPPPDKTHIILGAPTSDWIIRLHESVFQTIGPLDADAIRGFPAKYPRAWIEEAYRRTAQQMTATGKRISAPGSYLTAILDSMYESGLTGQGADHEQQSTRLNGLAANGQKSGSHSSRRSGQDGKTPKPPANQSGLGQPIVFANDAERLAFEREFADCIF